MYKTILSIIFGLLIVIAIYTISNATDFSKLQIILKAMLASQEQLPYFEGDKLLLETGDYLLLETGDKIVLE